MPVLNLLPADVDIKVYVGDDPIIEIEFFDDDDELEPSDLTDYTDWRATIRTGANQIADLTVDDSLQGDSVITVLFDGDLIRGFQSRHTRWDLQVHDPSDRIVTMCRGRVAVSNDVTPS